MVIDDQYVEWYSQVNGKEVDISWVVPVGGAMQGYPEAGPAFSKLMNETLKDIGMTTTTHEPCLYRGIIDGNEVFILRQVDDIAISTKTTATSQLVINMLNKKLDLTLQGIMDNQVYNGMNIEQTNEYVKLSSKRYITKLAKKHEK